MTDSDYILRCLQLARNGEYYVAPNPMVGAVLVNPADDTVFAEGWHKQFGQAHAEVECFRAADRRMAGLSPDEVSAMYGGLTLYVSLEPCSHYGKTPPCADLIISKGVRRVVVGCLDPNPQVAGRGVQKLRDAGIEVTVGVEEQACRELNKRFLCLHENHRPYVILKWAQTADGFVDTIRKDGTPLVISTPVTKQLVHKMRAENMAIMVGTRTALLDNPGLLTTRWPGRNPVRVVVDRHHRIPKDAKIFSPDAPTIVYDKQTDWPYILDDLASRGIHSILVEGGPTLLNHILESDIWDEMHIEVSPVTIGEGVPAPQVALPGSFELVDGERLYTIYHSGNKNCDYSNEK
ncbi:MAG: bifunctional diaminohydroxyphosphoribosylaminopyrimidine deaminase/5-amino-6-(5-phosphoribosylamino)uracil reductase RibD [Paludibacteraceae bacterium]|nr:bifunctional diaminohydroxyphosphoribosylaminopyrimidine deaminase/5-amino-6-(5-phosphoribosylamino)uracil reductase RibD [Paludibacteraceae bacterium]